MNLCGRGPLGGPKYLLFLWKGGGGQRERERERERERVFVAHAHPPRPKSPLHELQCEGRLRPSVLSPGRHQTRCPGSVVIFSGAGLGASRPLSSDPARRSSSAPQRWASSWTEGLAVGSWLRQASTRLRSAPSSAPAQSHSPGPSQEYFPLSTARAMLPPVDPRAYSKGDSPRRR